MIKFLKTERIFIESLTEQQQAKLKLTNVYRPAAISWEEEAGLELSRRQAEILRYAREDFKYYYGREQKRQ